MMFRHYSVHTVIICSGSKIIGCYLYCAFISSLGDTSNVKIASNCIVNFSKC